MEESKEERELVLERVRRKEYKEQKVAVLEEWEGDVMELLKEREPPRRWKA